MSAPRLLLSQTRRQHSGRKPPLPGRSYRPLRRGKYPPAKPGALGIGRSKRLWGTLTRPRFCWPLKGGLSATCSLVEPDIFSLLLADVFPDHRLVSTDGRDEVTPGPEVLPYEVALPLSIDPRQVDSALALDERTLHEVGEGPILLQKSFWCVEQKFLEPLMRFARDDVRDHIA